MCMNKGDREDGHFWCCKTMQEIDAAKALKKAELRRKKKQQADQEPAAHQTLQPAKKKENQRNTEKIRKQNSFHTGRPPPPI